MRICNLLICGVLLCSVNAGAQDKTQKSPVASQSKAETASPAGTSSSAVIDPQKEKDIRRLLEVTGAKARMEQVMGEMEKGIRPLMERSLPEGDYREKLIEAFFAKFHSKMDVQQLVDMAVPIYDKHLSHQEVKEMIQFYQTPIGQKTLEVLPQMTAELMDQGRQWGENLGRNSMMEVLAEHPEFEKAIEEAQKTSQP